MEFIIQILLFLIIKITLTYSYSVSNHLNSSEKDMIKYCSEYTNRNNPQCIDFLTKAKNLEDKCIKKVYEKCNLPLISKDNINEACEIYNSHNCQKIINDGIYHISECKEIQKYNEYFGTVIQSNFIIEGVPCQKDRFGNYCPISTSIIEAYEKIDNGEDENTNDILFSDNYIINETCKSQECTESLIKYYEFFIKLEEDLNDENDNINKNLRRRNFIMPNSENNSTNINELNKTMNKYLHSAECQNKMVTSNSSKVNSNKYNNLSIVILSLFILFLF